MSIVEPKKSCVQKFPKEQHNLFDVKDKKKIFIAFLDLFKNQMEFLQYLFGKFF